MKRRTGTLPAVPRGRELPRITDEERDRVLRALADGALSFRGLCSVLRTERVSYPWGHRGSWLEGRGLVRRSLLSCQDRGLIQRIYVQRPRARKDRRPRRRVSVYLRL